MTILKDVYLHILIFYKINIVKVLHLYNHLYQVQDYIKIHLI